MTARLLGLCALFFSGCTCGIALCNSDSDCGRGASCDPSTGVCLSDPGPDGGGTTAALILRVPPLAPRPAMGGAVYEDSPAAWRRSDQLFVWLEAPRALDSPSLKFGGVDAVPTDAAACVEPCSGNCYCFALDLAKPPLLGLRGSFALEGAGTDPEGKTVTGSGSLNVTRLSWRRGLGQPVRGTPALGIDGTVYVGTSGGAPSHSGNLFAIGFDGQERWNRSLGRIDASVLVTAPGPAPQQLFVGSISDNAMVTALDALGAQVAQCVLSVDAELEASPAAIALGAVFYANKTGQLIAFLPSRDPACELQQASNDVEYPDSLVASGDSVFFVDNNPSVHRYDLSGAGWVEYSQGQWPGSPHPSYRNRGLAAPSGGRLVGAGELQSGGTVFQATGSGPFKFDFGFSPPRVSASARGPVVTSDGLVLVGIPTGIAAVSTLDTQVGPGDRLVNTPVLGEGGRLYALAENGSLSEWSYAGGKPLRSWAAALEIGATTAFDASPTLDCARTAAGALAPGRPGILYAAGRSGTLQAIIVDARGIDTTAQWPKYQKDPRNSGAADTSLQEFACP